MIRLFTVAWVVLLAAVVVASPSSACGCGVAIEATVPAERVLIVTKDGREQLGTEPVSVDLWVVGDGPVAVPPLAQTYSGTVATLHPAVPSQYRRYLRGTWITRTDGNDLEPSTLTRDFAAVPVANPVTAQSTNRLAVHWGDTTEPKWWAWLLLGFGVTALVAFIVVTVRRA